MLLKLTSLRSPSMTSTLLPTQLSIKPLYLSMLSTLPLSMPPTTDLPPPDKQGWLLKYLKDYIYLTLCFFLSNLYLIYWFVFVANHVWNILFCPTQYSMLIWLGGVSLSPLELFLSSVIKPSVTVEWVTAPWDHAHEQLLHCGFLCRTPGSTLTSLEIGACWKLPKRLPLRVCGYCALLRQPWRRWVLLLKN